jgi:hypothetical protein
MEELKKFMLLGARIGTLSFSISEDEKIDFKDLPEVLKLLMQAKSFADIDYPKALDQFKNMTDEQKSELIIAFDKEFDISDEDKEQKIEQIISISFQIISFLIVLSQRCKNIVSLT